MLDQLRIANIIETSTVDVVNRSVCILFAQGCNLNCPFCHNSGLITSNGGKEYTQKNSYEIFKMLKENFLVSGVVLSGGEPTIQGDIGWIVEQISLTVQDFKNLLGQKFYIGIQTNGTMPEVIEDMLDYITGVAMDIKAIPEKYPSVTGKVGMKSQFNRVERTLEMLTNSWEINLEVKTTVVPPLVDEKDIVWIAGFLAEKRFKGTYVIQQYDPNGDVREEFRPGLNVPSREFLVELAKIAATIGKEKFEVAIRTTNNGYEVIE